LIYGELPTKPELESFDHSIRRHTLIHEDLKSFFDAFPQNAHPMSVLAAGVSALSTFYQDSLDPRDPEQVELSTRRLLAKLPVLAAYAYKTSLGQALLYPDNSLSTVENFLRLTFGTMAEDYVQNPIVTSALETLLILHADHEQNCSTSTVRLVGSAQANLFASVSSGINALFGPLHGGANEAVLDMLTQIRDSGQSVQQFVDRVKNKEDGTRLMGFGHRIYKNFDPRATIIKATADKVLGELGIQDPLLDIAKELEATALADPYFAERKLYPNVDFYTGVIYKALGFPAPMFTALFAMGRLPGWIAHWREMMGDSSNRIGRPQQVYLGKGERSF
jgi:citrate synthase